MNDLVTRGTLFKPAASRAESKAQMTDTAARSIIESEIAEREAKTARLRAARLEAEKREAKAPAKPAAKPKRTKKPSA